MHDAGPIELQGILAAEYHALRPGSDFAAESTTGLFSLVHQDAQGLGALCISGGGIRSATFALGAIQSMAKWGLLERFDYLSTVSGRGYIGAWLSAWSHRAGGLEAILPNLRPDAKPAAPGAPDPVAHLRDYNNYLSPRLGAMSADTWTLAATILTNLLLNWLVLLPLPMAALMVPRLFLPALVFPELVFGSFIFSGAPLTPPNYGVIELDAVSHSLAVHYGLPLLSAGLFAIALFNTLRYLPGVDAAGDPGCELEGLGDALRKIRVDHGIPITFDDASMRALRARQGRCTVATIGYSAVDAGAPDGRLIYLKPVLLGNEPADVGSYGRTHPEFAHQSTANQWFDESQTESYRMLGQQTVDDLCQHWPGGSLQAFARHLEVANALVGAANPAVTPVQTPR